MSEFHYDNFNPPFYPPDGVCSHVPEYHYDYYFNSSFYPPDEVYGGFVEGRGSEYPPVCSDVVYAGQADNINQVDCPIDGPFDSVQFAAALANMDQQSFDHVCQVLVPQAVHEPPVNQTGFLPTAMDYVCPVDATSQLSDTEYNMSSAMLPQDAFAGGDVARPQGLEQRSQTAIADNTNIIQEPDYAIPYFGVASPEHSETVATSTSPSPPSSSATPMTPSEAAHPTHAQDGTNDTSGLGQGPISSPNSAFTCTGYGENLSDGIELKQEEQTHHARQRWYCPGLDASYTTSVEPCGSPPRGYSRSDVLLKHIRERGPTTLCYRLAYARGWRPDARGSIKYLKGYEPQQRRN